MRLKCTKRFLTSVEKLLSKPKHYGCIKNNLYVFLLGQSDEELFEAGFMLSKPHPVVRFIKKRVLPCGNNGKSAGFRLIVFVNQKESTAYLLDIYPKTDPLNKSNMQRDERKECIDELKYEKAAERLINVVLNEALQEISFDV